METHGITQDLTLNSNREPGQQLHPGTTLENRYLIKDVIGIGGMGAVYRAQDLHFPSVLKFVAVKEIINQVPDPSNRKTVVSNFEREANLLATLDHPAIPRIYDYFTTNNRCYLVLEHISGKNLETIISESDRFIPENRALAWAIELCDVLDYLHSHKPTPIIFRDIKPSNIMVNSLDHIVLVDFGIAKPFQTGQRGTMIGTEGYSPPEQYRGEATPLADIYSLGAALHHLLTRKDPRYEPPFSFSEIPIWNINPQVSPEFERIVFKALEYQPEDRFQSARAMQEALLAVWDQTYQADLPAVQPDFITRNGFNSRNGFKNRNGFTNRNNEDIRPAWSFACEDEIRGTPTYHQGIVYIGSYDNNLYALNALNGEFFWKYATDGGIVSKPLVYEDDIFFGSEDHRLHAVNPRSGKVNWTYFTKGPIRSSPHIAEGHIFIGSDDGYLHAINTLSGRRAWQVETGAPVRSTPLVDNETIFFGNEAGLFFSLDFGGDVKWRFKAKRAVTSSPVINEGILYFGSVDTSLYALEAKSGWVIWRFRLGKASISTPFIFDRILFTGATDGILYAIETTSSKELWRFATQNQVTGSPVIYKDSLYCGSVDGHLYCLEYSTGRLRWKYKTGGPITGTPVAYEDMVYFGSTDNRIYAFNA